MRTRGEARVQSRSLSSRTQPRFLRMRVRDLLLTYVLCCEVFPCWIGASDQPKFFLASPRLDFFLPSDRVANVPEHFIMHEAENSIPRREARHESFTVFDEAPPQIVCYAYIEISRTAREDINAVGSVHSRDPYVGRS
jgi:hypothetical protein